MSKIFASNTKSEINFAELCEKLQKYDVILFGEYHGNKELHRLEKEIFATLDQHHLALEMLEKNVQIVTDDYLNNLISKQEFLENCHPWPNMEDYLPLIEQVKAKGKKLGAGNIPLAIAKIVSQNGFAGLSLLNEDLKRFLPQKLSAPENSYKEMFFAEMNGPLKHSHGVLTQINIQHFYEAQCLKDDSMAETIAHLATEGKVFHVNGQFHSSHYGGIAAKLKELNPNLSIAVIAPILSKQELLFTAGDYLVKLSVGEDNG